MTDNIVSLSSKRDDNRFITLEQQLAKGLDHLKDGSVKANKGMVLFLDTDGDNYGAGYMAANLNKAEMLALLSRIAHAVNMSM